MSNTYALLLGVVQGLTEFLPVSSSGHLVIVESLLPNLETPGVLFETALHAGTMLSIVVYLRNKLRKLLVENWMKLLIGSVPAGIVGLLLDDYIEFLFASVTVVGVFLIVTALFNYLTDHYEGNIDRVSSVSAVIIGVAQSVAILPGISRSGLTIFTASKLGINKQRAAEFSFLLSVPAIIGANLIQIVKYGGESSITSSVYLVGFGAAFVSGYVAIGVLMKVLVSKHFKVFSIYCLIVAFSVLLIM